MSNNRTEAKFLSTHRNTIYFRGSTLIEMQVYTKSHKRVKEISKMPSLQRTPTTEAHLILSVATQHLQGLSKVHPNPYLTQLLLPTLYLATVQTNQGFARNI